MCKNNGVLFENQLLQIGIKSEYRQNLGELSSQKSGRRKEEEEEEVQRKKKKKKRHTRVSCLKVKQFSRSSSDVHLFFLL